jgi:hypothetical protein
MRRPQAIWLVSIAVLALVAAATAPAFPQESETRPATPADADRPENAAKAKETIDLILRQQEESLRGDRFNYDPGTRRDPFQSLFDLAREKKGERPKGIEGMAVDEIDLAGIVKDSKGGNLAYFTGSDNRGYFLRVGERIFDATMIAIDPLVGAVTFRQQIDDPRQIKPYRDVVRKLASVEESAHE